MAKLRIFLALLLFMGAVGSSADTLKLSDGDVLSGDLVRLGNGVLVFRTPLAGQIIVPERKVEGLTTDSAYKISLSGGQLREGRFVVSGGATCLREPGPTGGTAPINLAQVKELRPSSALIESERPSRSKSQLRGEWSAGARFRFNDANYTAPYGRLSLSQNAERYQFESDVLLEAAPGDEFPRFFRGEATWKLGPPAGVSPFIAVGVERDTGRELELRASLGAGAQRILFDNDRSLLLGDAGIEGTTESYDTDYRFPGLKLGAREHDEQELNLRLGTRYEYAFTGKAAVAKELYFLPSLTDFGDLRAYSRTSLLFPVASRLSLRLDLEFDYDSDPFVSDLDKWQTSVGASLVLDF